MERWRREENTFKGLLVEWKKPWPSQHWEAGRVRFFLAVARHGWFLPSFWEMKEEGCSIFFFWRGFDSVLLHDTLKPEKQTVYSQAAFGLALFCETGLGSEWCIMGKLCNVNYSRLAVKATMCSQSPLSKCCNLQLHWRKFKNPNELFICILNWIVNFVDHLNLYVCSM